MPETTGDYSSEALATQQAELELPRFGLAEAVALGLLATDRAIAGDLAVVIEVVHVGRVVYRAVLPGSLPDSDDWIARKRRTVERFGRSTLATRVRYEERGTTFNESSGLSELEYAAHGGGMPIQVAGVGIVGGCYVSGLPQVDDHEFIVACLRELKTTLTG
jgi:uncharacterized protein (UPF0303 family)